jgi:hypothetical protein
MKRGDSVEKLGRLIAAFVRGLSSDDCAAVTLPRTTFDADAIQATLDAQIAQREEIFAFHVIERVFDRGIERKSSNAGPRPTAISFNMVGVVGSNGGGTASRSKARARRTRPVKRARRQGNAKPRLI